MVHYSKVLNGLVQFIDEDMIQKMTGSWKAWGIGTVVALVANRGEAIFRKVQENEFLKSMGLVEGEMVDVESIYSELLKQAQKGTATVEFPIIGPVTYSSSDVEHLYRLIMR